MHNIARRVGRILILGLIFAILTILILTGIFKTDLGFRFVQTLPDLFWDFFYLFFEPTNAEEGADFELIALTSLSALIAAVLLATATRLSRLLRLR